MLRFRRRRKPEEADIIEGEIEEIAASEEESPAPEAPPPPQPRRRRFLGRRERPTAAPTAGLADDVPLERVAPDIPTPDESMLVPYVRREDTSPPKPTARPRLRLPRLPRILVWSEVRPGLLLLALGLIAGGVFWTMHNRGQASESAEQWWPAVVLGCAMIWAIFALVTRRAASFLAASALAGISISLLMDTQDILAWRETLVGSVLIAVGVGIMARGLLLRQGSVA